jgi:hypothetical protein
MNSNNKIDCIKLVLDYRSGNQNNIEKRALKQCEESNDLWEKCVLLKFFTSPQSNKAEEIIKKDLKIAHPVNNTSGDGNKKGINYEIKVSIHDKKGLVNLRQIRPHHNIDYYIIVSYNLFKTPLGQAAIFKIPSSVLYGCIPEYGGYTHGTVDRNGEITSQSVHDTGTDFEYSLTANPNADSSKKQGRLWQLFKEWAVDYNEFNF